MILGQRAESSGSLDDYLGGIATRLRAAAATRGAGAVALTALLATALGVYLANRAAFSTASVAGSRALLLLALATVTVVLLVLPLRRFMHGQGFLLAATEAERRVPQFGGRLRTWADERLRSESRGRAPSPLLALLARDTSEAAAQVPVATVVGWHATAAFAIAACFGIASLVWLGTSGPGYWQYGTARLWAGWFLAQDDPLYELAVEPGDTTIRQGGRLEVTAAPTGFEPSSVEIFAKFESSEDWERAPMGPRLGASGYEFAFSVVREPLRYYVEAGRLRSPEFNVGVVEMPTVESIRLEYAYPKWSGLEPLVEDPGDDIVAVPGTRVTVNLTTDRPLEGGLLVVGESEVPIRNDRAAIEVEDDSVYHVAAIYQGERVRLTEDFFITAVPDQKPEVKILEPGRDWRASAIEEVTVRVEASDDFGLRDVELRYAVNGQEQGAVKIPRKAGGKRALASHVFYLEDFGPPGASTLPSPGGDGGLPPPAPAAGLLPGDLVSYYLLAKDAKTETRSDIYFINVQPYERRFSQSQQAGGQGGQGQRQDEISRRQKEIIIATWNLIKERDSDDGREPDKLRESASMLSELQGTLMQQAQTLVQRTRARQITGADPKFAQFAAFMEQAAGFMEPASVALHDFRLDDAVGPEQQALQFLLRAENLFTDIQLTMGRGGAGGGLSRDLAEMFELEMDLEKNQYETGGGASGQQIEQEIDEAMKKLEELARRQERLAERAEDRSRASFEQRWQQEMLRREAEDLKRQMEQLQRRQQARSQQASGRSGRGSPSGGSGSSRQLDRTIQQLERATREMERGSRGGDPAASSQGAQRELERALDELAEQRQRQTESAISGMAAEATKLAQEQEAAAAELQKSLKVALEALKAQGGRQTGNLPTGMTREEEIDLAARKSDMGERLAEIEKGIQRQSRLLRGRNEEASRALMESLLELQQSEASPAIQYAAEMIRRGLAPYVASNEEAVSRALRRLRDNLREAGQLAQGETQGSERGMAGLLSDVEGLRRRLEQAARQGASEGERAAAGGRRQGGQESGQDSGGNGRESRGGDPNRPGQNPGGGRSGADWRGGWASDGSLGDGRWRGNFGPVGGDRTARERMERALESGAIEIPRLVERMRSNREFDPADILALRQFARELGDGRFTGNPALLDREYRKMIALLEQLEVQLRRHVELDDKDEVRAIVSEIVPEPYREAVAEYYRKLGSAR